MEPTAHHRPAATHLRDYLRILRRRKWILVAAVLALEAAVAVGTLLQTPLYRATAKVLIEREAPRVVSFEEVSRIDTSQDYYQTQYEIIRSRPLIENVLRRLDLIEKRPRLATAQDPAAAFLRSITIEPIRNSRLVGITVEDENPQMAADIANLIAALYVEETIHIRLEAARQALGWLSDQLIDVKAKAQDAETSLQRYKEEAGLIAVEEKQDITIKKLEEFNSEYIAAKARRLELEAQLVDLRRGLGDRDRLAAAPVVVQNPLIQKLRTDLVTLQVRSSELQPDLTDKHPEMVKLRSQIDKINKAIDAEVTRLVRSLETEYRSLRAREEAMLDAVNQYRDEAQALASKQIQYGVLKREADSTHEMYNLLLKRVKETTLEGGLPTTNVRLVEEATAPRAPASPNRGLNLALGLLVALCFGLGAVFFAEYMDDTVRTAQEVESLTGLSVIGVIPTVAAPRAHLAHASAFALIPVTGTVLIENPASVATPLPVFLWGAVGVATVVVLALAVVHVRRRTEARGTAAPAPPAQLPKQAANGTTPVLLYNGSGAASTEAFRGIRTQIIIMMRQRKLRHLVITSSGPGEGKSTVAANLALVTARAGHKVLLVDADLHRPQLHGMFAVPNEKGLAELLRSDTDAVDHTLVSQACIGTAIANLSLLPAGVPPQESAEAFAGQIMRNIVAILAAEYELVIYDSPPVLSVADPTVLAAMADGVLLVVRVGRYPRQAIQQAAAALQAVDAKMIGCVLNGVDATSSRDSYGYYGYYRYPYPEPRSS